MSERKKVSQIAQESAMRCIPMIGEGEAYRQRIDDFKKGYMTGHFAVSELIKSLEQEVVSADLYTMKAGRYGDMALEALKELVELKLIKDTNGKTAIYLERQPKAWEQARKLLRGEF